MLFERATVAQSSILDNLLQLYMHDMSEWFGIAPDNRGRFGFVAYDHFTTGEPVYLAFDDESSASMLPIGFAMVSESSLQHGAQKHVSEYDLEEFFLMRKYRHRGIGEQFTNHIWDTTKGNWLIRVYDGNKPAVPFWRRTIAGYTDKFTEDTIDKEGSTWLNFRFDNSSPGEPTLP
jgi:predicted acetyltransferase